MADPSFIVRLPQDELDALDAWSTTKGHKSRNVAAREAMRLGMQETAAPIPIAHTPSNGPAGVTPLNARQAQVGLTPPPEVAGYVIKRPDFGAKVDTSSVPFAGALDRRPYQRATRGKPLAPG